MGILPLGLANRPEEHQLGHHLMQAFNVLSSSRQYGMSGPQPISLAEMYSYCKMFALADVDERENFVATMQRLDATYMADISKRFAATKTSSVVVDSSAAPDNSAKG